MDVDMIARDAEKGLGIFGFKIQTGTVFFLSTLATIFITAWIMSQGTLFSWDVSWLMEASRRLLAGGTYAKDFFENNPPLILYLYIPGVLIVKFFHLNPEIAFRVYFFSLVASTLVINNILLEKILPADVMMRRFFLLMFAAMVLIFPNYELGQRDQFVSVLVMPYILLLCCRLQNQPIARPLAIMVGLIAGCGFAVKPVFMLIWFLLEGYYYFRKKSLHAMLRSETKSIVGLVSVYILLVYYLHPDYLTIVMPFSLRWCYVTTRMPMLWLATNIPSVYSYFILGFFAIQYPHIRHKTLASLLALTLLGFLCAFVFQRTYWWYHEVPFYTYDVMLSLVLFYEYINRSAVSRVETWFMVGFLAIFLDYLIHYIVRVPPVLFYHPVSYLLFFAVLAALVLIFQQRHARAIVLLKNNIVAICLGTLLFFYPFFMSNLTYFGHQKDDAGLEKFTKIVNQFAANKTILALTTDMWLPNPNLAETMDASRFSCSWLVPGLYAPGYPTDQKHLLLRDTDRNFLINMVAEDINEKKPEYIFVDIKKHKMEFWTYFEDSAEQNRDYFDFDYLNEFSKNKQFNQAFKSYHFLRVLEVGISGRLAAALTDLPQYKVAIYERNHG
jgi:hypothetical protein